MWKYGQVKFPIWNSFCWTLFAGADKFGAFERFEQEGGWSVKDFWTFYLSVYFHPMLIKSQRITIACLAWKGNSLKTWCHILIFKENINNRIMRGNFLKSFHCYIAAQKWQLSCLIPAHLATSVTLLLPSSYLQWDIIPIKLSWDLEETLLYSFTDGNLSNKVPHPESHVWINGYK